MAPSVIIKRTLYVRDFICRESYSAAYLMAKSKISDSFVGPCILTFFKFSLYNLMT